MEASERKHTSGSEEQKHRIQQNKATDAQVCGI